MKKYTRPNLTPTPAQIATRARLHAEAKTRPLASLHLVRGYAVIWHAVKRRGQRSVFTPDTAFSQRDHNDDKFPVNYKHTPDSYLGYTLSASFDDTGVMVTLALCPAPAQTIITGLKAGTMYGLSIGTPMQNDGKVKYTTRKPVKGVFQIIEYVIDHIAITDEPDAGTQTAITLVHEAVTPPNHDIIQGST